MRMCCKYQYQLLTKKYGTIGIFTCKRCGEITKIDSEEFLELEKFINSKNHINNNEQSEPNAEN